MELTEARESALGLTPTGGIESIELREALGRVLAESIASSFDSPRESRSRFDGFALRSSDTLGASLQSPVALRIREGLLAAGHEAKLSIDPGECVRILTGAPLPRNADGVALQEETFREGQQLILKRALAPGHGIAPAGQEIKKGELLFAEGELLTPTRMALIAALGYAKVAVYLRPRVALLATGDELRELGTPLEGPSMYCNNRHLLAWMVALHGGAPVQEEIVGDDPKAIAEWLKDAEADVIISTGGVGGGTRDFTLQAWKTIGARLRFSEVNLSPGRNSALGYREGQILFGLPGNPWGSQIIFEELVAPVLWRRQGLKEQDRPYIAARMAATIRKKKGFYKAIRGILNLQTAPASFEPMDSGRKSHFAALRNHFNYTLLGPDVVEAPKGSEVKVRFHDFPLLAYPSLGILENVARAF